MYLLRRDYRSGDLGESIGKYESPQAWKEIILLPGEPGAEIPFSERSQLFRSHSVISFLVSQVFSEDLDPKVMSIHDPSDRLFFD